MRTLARHLGVSRTLVHGVWQGYAVQPHRVERFQLSNDPKFEEKVRDVVGLYVDPPDRALVLCVDQKSQIQRWAAPLPCCRYGQDYRSARPTTTSGTEPRLCLLPSTS